MSVQNRIKSITELGKFFGAITSENISENSFSDESINEFRQKMKQSEIQNSWFTDENLKFCLKQWSKILTEENLKNWIKQYKTDNSPKNIGVVMAGNLPLVGLHDLISVILSGHNPIVKTSSKDTVLMSAVIDFLTERNPSLKDVIKKTERLKEQDAVIATGSNNTARYFEYYFKDIPHIIRKNRTSVAVLDGNETKQDLKNLANDIFRYFGLGCRNVTRLYLPENFNTDLLFEAFYDWKEIINHNKYANNYDYNRAVYLMSKDKFLDNNFVILKESDSFHSPIGVVFYSFYKNSDEVKKELTEKSEEIQCVVGNLFMDFKNSVDFGQTQMPKLNDYADGVDVMKFLEF